MAVYAPALSMLPPGGYRGNLTQENPNVIPARLEIMSCQKFILTLN